MMRFDVVAHGCCNRNSPREAEAAKGFDAQLIPCSLAPSFKLIPIPPTAWRHALRIIKLTHPRSAPRHIVSLTRSRLSVGRLRYSRACARAAGGLFTAGALAVIRYAKIRGTKHRPWLTARAH